MKKKFTHKARKHASPEKIWEVSEYLAGKIGKHVSLGEASLQRQRDDFFSNVQIEEEGGGGGGEIKKQEILAQSKN